MVSRRILSGDCVAGNDSVMKLVLLILAFTLIAVPIHEVRHYIALKLLGGYGYIEIDALCGRVVVAKQPSNMVAVAS